MKKRVRLIVILMSAIMALGLAGCNNNSNNEETTPISSKEDNTTEQTQTTKQELETTTEPETTTEYIPETTTSSLLELTAVLNEEEMATLEELYPNLERLDVTGSDCYEAILSYAEAHPEVEVIYTVALGATTVANTETTLELVEGSYDYEAVKTGLKYLPNISVVTFTETMLSTDAIEELRKLYPEIGIKYTLGEVETESVVAPTESSITDTKITVDPSWIYCDWSGYSSSDIDTVIAKAKELNGNYVVKLSSNLTRENVKALQQAAPDILFDYSFDLFGKTLSTLNNTVSYVDVGIGDAGEQEIRAALDILTKCTYFKLDNCGISNEILDRLRNDYTGRTQVVWRVFCGQKSWLTDTISLRAVYGVNDGNSEPLKYLTSVKYVDMGHNTEMTDISFLGYMPDLELAILSGSPIMDLSPLANCKKLEFLELAWCGWLNDISPLEHCISLKHLNLGHTKVSDLSALKNLSLEQLSYVNSGNEVGFTEETWAEIKAQHPNCIVTYEPLADNDATPYSVGWRYKAEGGYTDYYYKIRQIFNYDYLDWLIQNGAK